VVIVGDINRERLAQARSFGCETIDLTRSGGLPDMIAQIVDEPVVDAAVDCVGFEAHGHGASAGEAPATALNDVIGITRVGGQVGIPGLYVTADPGGVDENARIGQLDIHQLMNAILHDKVQIARAVNAIVIPLEQAPEGYKEFDEGVAKKFVLNPHGMIAA
jgi:glutathione-independent formaldehyde dehydrogenase